MTSFLRQAGARLKSAVGLILLLAGPTGLAGAEPGVISATDESRVKRTGKWIAHEFRRASTGHLFTEEDGAAIELPFTGTGIVVTLDGHGMPFAHLGSPHLGKLMAEVDGHAVAVVEPQREDRDVVLARGLPNGPHKLRLAHRHTPAGNGCRIAAFRVLTGGEGELSFLLHADANRFLTDVRLTISKPGSIVENRLARSWLTGQCRIAGLPAGSGYQVEVVAAGWDKLVLRDVRIESGKETVLPPQYIRRSAEATIAGVQFPRMGGTAILRAGDSFEARFARNEAELRSVELRRQIGPAVISRRARFVENEAREYDFKSEGTVALPADIPPGLYDLVFTLTADGVTTRQISPRSVYVVNAYPQDPVFVTFGHMDTWGQEQAEYLERLAEISNLVGADAVLVSDEINAAYAAGAFARLEMPYLINFGNHGVGGHQEWYGNDVSRVDFGPHLSILNFGPPWHGDVSHASALLDAVPATTCKIINAFESDAPLEMLDRLRIPYLHEAHGPGPKVMTMGKTPTQRAGKVNSESFRVVRFKGCKPVSFTYAGDRQAPIPLPRHQRSPLSIAYSPANDGTNSKVEATVRNDWAEAFPQARLTFVVPAGQYSAGGGRIESSIASDDGRYVVLSVRFDLPAKTTSRVGVTQK